MADYFESIGSVGLNRMDRYIYEDTLPQLRWPLAARVYQEMADNDAVIGAIMYMAKQLIRKAEWKVEVVNETPEDQAAADFITTCMNDMENSWKDFISEILSMLVYGWSFHEIVYKIRKGPTETNPMYKSKYSDGKIGWRKIPVRSQATLYGWLYDEDEKLIAMEQWAPPTYKVRTIPIEKGLLFRTETTRENPEGRSLLRNAYRPWYYKKHIEEIEGIGIERDLAGLPVIIPPENVDIWNDSDPLAALYRNKALSIVSSVRRDRSEGLVIPYGWDFKLVNTGGSRQFDTNAIINRYDQRIAITMLSDIVMLGADKVGSFALADVKKSLLASSLESIIQDIAAVLNKFAVPQLLQLNNIHLEEPPIFVPSEIEVPGLKELGDFIRATGLDVYDDLEFLNYLRRLASAPLLSEDDFNRIKKEQATVGRKEPKPEVSNNGVL